MLEGSGPALRVSHLRRHFWKPCGRKVFAVGFLWLWDWDRILICVYSSSSATTATAESAESLQAPSRSLGRSPSILSSSLRSASVFQYIAELDATDGAEALLLRCVARASDSCWSLFVRFFSSMPLHFHCEVFPALPPPPANIKAYKDIGSALCICI